MDGFWCLITETKTRIFLNPITSVDICIIGRCQLFVYHLVHVFTPNIGTDIAFIDLRHVFDRDRTSFA